MLRIGYVVLKIASLAFKHVTLKTEGENTLALISDLKLFFLMFEN